MLKLVVWLFLVVSCECVVVLNSFHPNAAEISSKPSDLIVARERRDNSPDSVLDDKGDNGTVETTTDWCLEEADYELYEKNRILDGFTVKLMLEKERARYGMRLFFFFPGFLIGLLLGLLILLGLIFLLRDFIYKKWYAAMKQQQDSESTSTNFASTVSSSRKNLSKEPISKNSESQMSAFSRAQPTEDLLPSVPQGKNTSVDEVTGSKDLTQSVKPISKIVRQPAKIDGAETAITAATATVSTTPIVPPQKGQLSGKSGKSGKSGNKLSSADKVTIPQGGPMPADPKNNEDDDEDDEDEDTTRHKEALQKFIKERRLDTPATKPRKKAMTRGGVTADMGTYVDVGKNAVVQ